MGDSKNFLVGALDFRWMTYATSPFRRRKSSNIIYVLVTSPPYHFPQMDVFIGRRLAIPPVRPPSGNGDMPIQPPPYVAATILAQKNQTDDVFMANYFLPLKFRTSKFSKKIRTSQQQHLHLFFSLASQTVKLSKIHCQQTTTT